METLTLEQMYYIGELLAAVVVIVSVIYLALQVRQNAISTRLNTLAEINAGFKSFYQSIGENRDLADIYMRGLSNFEGLDRLEKMRFKIFIRRAFVLGWGSIRANSFNSSRERWYKPSAE